MRPLHVAGHFGEWVQGRLGPQGPVALITLPCARLGVELAHHPSRTGLTLSGLGLTPMHALRFLRALGVDLRGTVRMRALAAPGLGTGVSTARLVALARLAGWAGPPEVLAQACIGAEGASDPLMFDAPERLLWASRVGRVLADLPGLPRYEIVGGFWGEPRWTDPSDTRFADISDLVQAWRGASGLDVLARLASESAARCAVLRGPADDPTPDLARSLGALGWMRAHTGAARGLIYAPGTAPTLAEAALRAAGFRGVLRFRGGAR